MKKLIVKIKLISCYLIIGFALILPTIITISFYQPLLKYYTKITLLNKGAKKWN